MLWQFQVGSKRTQSHTYMHPFSPKLPAHPSCHLTLNSYHFKYNSLYIRSHTPIYSLHHSPLTTINSFSKFVRPFLFCELSSFAWFLFSLKIISCGSYRLILQSPPQSHLLFFMEYSMLAAEWFCLPVLTLQHFGGPTPFFYFVLCLFRFKLAPFYWHKILRTLWVFHACHGIQSIKQEPNPQISCFLLIIL